MPLWTGTLSPVKLPPLMLPDPIPTRAPVGEPRRSTAPASCTVYPAGAVMFPSMLEVVTLSSVMSAPVTVAPSVSDKEVLPKPVKAVGGPPEAVAVSAYRVAARVAPPPHPSVSGPKLGPSPALNRVPPSTYRSEPGTSAPTSPLASVTPIDPETSALCWVGPTSMSDRVGSLRVSPR